MPLIPLAEAGTAGIPIHLVNEKDWSEQKETLPAFVISAVNAYGFKPLPGKHLIALTPKGTIGAVLFGITRMDNPKADPFALGALPQHLPAGTYKLAGYPAKTDLAALSWMLAGYSFTRYKSKPVCDVRLVTPRNVNRDEIIRIAEAIALGRDLVNIPASDLGPAGLEDAATKLAKKHDAKIRVVSGDKLLEKNFPLIHAVGRAASEEPRLINLSWGNKENPLVTLVGKGVAFDTGGLDIKPSSSMLLMKKDMGGAAAALALGDMIMGANLPVRLRILIPAVENAISAGSFRPGDILHSRKGLSVEIGNTDAEGRLVLADALAFADEEEPDLLIDFATLTGAARVALGPDLPPFYTHDEILAEQIQKNAAEVNDPVWRMPLWQPYQSYIDTDIADINNSSNAPYAGSITAALFLNRFVEKTRSYAHFDIFAWTPYAKAGRPKGGEVQAARLLYALLKKRYKASSGQK